MSSESENFDSLRRLLALKRHEQPPPGYFNNLPGEVISRIREEQQRAQNLEKRFEQAPWLLRMFSMLETKPVFAGAFGIAVCALMISAIIYSEQVPPTPVAVVLTDMSGSSLMGSVASSKDSVAGVIPVSATTNSSALEASTLFDKIQIKTMPVDFSRPGGF